MDVVDSPQTSVDRWARVVRLVSIVDGASVILYLLFNVLLSFLVSDLVLGTALSIQAFGVLMAYFLSFGADRSILELAGSGDRSGAVGVAAVGTLLVALLSLPVSMLLVWLGPAAWFDGVSSAWWVVSVAVFAAGVGTIKFFRAFAVATGDVRLHFWFHAWLVALTFVFLAVLWAGWVEPSVFVLTAGRAAYLVVTAWIGFVLVGWGDPRHWVIDARKFLVAVAATLPVFTPSVLVVLWYELVAAITAGAAAIAESDMANFWFAVWFAELGFIFGVNSDKGLVSSSAGLDRGLVAQRARVMVVDLLRSLSVAGPVSLFLAAMSVWLLPGRTLDVLTLTLLMVLLVPVMALAAGFVGLCQVAKRGRLCLATSVLSTLFGVVVSLVTSRSLGVYGLMLGSLVFGLGFVAAGWVVLRGLNNGEA